MNSINQGDFDAEVSRTCNTYVDSITNDANTQPLILHGPMYGIQELCAELLIERISGMPATRNVDLIYVRPEQNTIDIDAIRSLLASAALSSAHGTRYILITQSERLTPAAANALLKSIEEHSKHTRWIFTTAHLESIPLTIRSRCRMSAVPVFQSKWFAEHCSQFAHLLPYGSYILQRSIASSSDVAQLVKEAIDTWAAWSEQSLKRKEIQRMLDLLEKHFDLYDPLMIYVDIGIAVLQYKLKSVLAAIEQESRGAERIVLQLDFLRNIRHTIVHNGNKTLIFEAFVCHIYDTLGA